jgi:hypothetical protein
MGLTRNPMHSHPNRPPFNRDRKLPHTASTFAHWLRRFQRYEMDGSCRYHHGGRRRDVVIGDGPLLPCASKFLPQPSPIDCRPLHRRRPETAISLLARHQTTDVFSRKYLIFPFEPHASVASAGRFPCLAQCYPRCRGLEPARWDVLSRLPVPIWRRETGRISHRFAKRRRAYKRRQSCPDGVAIMSQISGWRAVSLDATPTRRHNAPLTEWSPLDLDLTVNAAAKPTSV